MIYNWISAQALNISECYENSILQEIVIFSEKGSRNLKSKICGDSLHKKN